ncbi:hypothetical protein [Pseudoalteromonas agarivorans]|uniref:Uncharacterized protein n=1 Tax=Pseudoalteromonas agarivorans DSM 14585 TaxID=1312369 RepID=A0ACA8DTV8_9GAMM|nr:hypothetical protein [Pseudoalteromonas agarivorans]ATC81461.1 hypothetical protein PAGA_a0980 [Pseudoalteromonas agarivorans DSM 14585]
MKILSIIFVLALLVPIFLYTNQFGLGLWDDHAKWAEMGSFFGGILGPIVTVISIGFIYIQLKVHQKQQQYTLDTLKLQKIESDILFFSAVVKSELSREISTMDNKTLNSILSNHAAEFCSVHTHYQGSEDPDLIVKEFGLRSFDFLICYESLFASWRAINAQLHSLKALDEALSMENYKSQLARVFTTLDSYICSHLDTISMTLDNGFNPHFRPSFEDSRAEVQESMGKRI